MNPPPIIPYHQPTTPSSHTGTPHPVRQFLLGLFGGGAVSAICWGITFVADRNATQPFFLVLMWLLPLAKLIAGITFLCIPHRRLLGGGILTSIALGGLIFFGFCSIAIARGS